MKNRYLIQIDQGATSVGRIERKLLERLRGLIEDADVFGYVITVEQTALKPLAMGHYSTTASIRPSRDRQGEN